MRALYLRLFCLGETLHTVERYDILTQFIDTIGIRHVKKILKFVNGRATDRHFAQIAFAW